MDRLSPREARRYLLAVQGLWPSGNLKGESGVLEILDRLRCLQFDPIDIVGRNHEIALQARIKGFNRNMLDRILYDSRIVVEGWDKQMSLLPMEDRPYFAVERLENENHLRFREDGPLNEVLPAVREEIRKRGPLSSLDFESKEKINWAWAPAKAVRAALEALWFRGELMIHHRQGSRRYFDLAERLLPAHLVDPSPPAGGAAIGGSGALPPRSTPDGPAVTGIAGNVVSEWPPTASDVLVNERLYRGWRIARRIGSVGVLRASSGDGWLGLGIPAAERRRLLGELAERRVILPFQVDGHKEPWYRLNSQNEIFQNIIEQLKSPPLRAAVLAPLDNLIWDREMIRQIFGFHYLWEVYKPESRRQWGYYVLPILYGDHFVARFEPGRDRVSGELLVKQFWTEPGITVTGVMSSAVRKALLRLARSNGLQSVRVAESASGEELLKEFRR